MILRPFYPFSVKILFVCIICAFFSRDIFGQKVLEIRDARTQKTLEDVQILNQDSTVTYFSSQLGLVIVEGDQNDVFFISKKGYESQFYWLEKRDLQYVSLVWAHEYITEDMVEAFHAEKTLAGETASIGVINPYQLNSYSGGSLVPVFNNVPGVRMEEMSPGSYRLSIRGSMLRDPFGIRNVKMYWNGIPFTLANGSTPFNMLNANSIGHAEVIKGPASSLYGEGIGGVVLLGTPNPQEKHSEFNYMRGSFNSTKVDLSSFYPLKNGNFAGSVNIFVTDGYREHSSLSRTNSWLEYKQRILKGWEMKTFLLANQLDYKLPGGLTEQELETNPKIARSESVLQNNSVSAVSLILGLGYDAQISEKFYHTFNNSLHLGVLDSPLLTDFRSDSEYNYAGRTLFGYREKFGDWELDIQTGVEGNYGNRNALSYGNREGRRDTIRFEDQIQHQNLFGFLQTTIYWKNRWSLTSGFSLNSIKQDINRLRDAALDSSYRDEVRHKGILTPRFAIGYKLNDDWLLHASWSNGFSSPTLDEIRTNDGSINRNLRPEIGINREIGVRGFTLDKRLQLDFTFFRLNMSETIVNYVNEEGIILFRNAGNTRHAGVENLIQYHLVDQKSQFLKSWTIQHALTRNTFRFQNYQRGGVDYSGNKITGVPSWVSVWNSNIESKKGAYLSITYNYTSEIPLNDANTVFADDYHLVQSKAGYKFKLRKKMLGEIYAGVDNLLNENYSLGNDLNAFGGRFFQPAPNRNYFFGIKAMM